MTREILFQGFHPCEGGDTTIYVEGEAVKGMWVEGYNVRLTNGKKTVNRIYTGFAATDCDDWFPDYFNVLPSTVGQYTGMTDRNGEKIFTNDRLDLTDWAKRDRTVEVLGFHNGVCWFGGDGFSDEYIFNSNNRLVIGTIFDKEVQLWQANSTATM